MEPKQQSSSIAMPIAIIFGFGLIALAVYFSGLGQKTTTDDTANNVVTENNDGEIKTVDDSDYIRGNPNAPILIVEYSDYDCPFCKNFHRTMNQIMNEYGAEGKVAWVYRQYPIAELHPNAPRISEAALCVGEIGGNNSFWKFTDLIFQERGADQMTNISRLSEYAKTAGVDTKQYEECVKSGRQQENVEASLRDGAQAGIGGTPHSFIIVGNQKAPLEGAQPYEAVKQIIENLISQMEGVDPSQAEGETLNSETPSPSQ